MIIGFHGAMRHGKTITLVRFAKKAFDMGRKIITIEGNIQLNFTHEIIPLSTFLTTDPKEWMDLFDCFIPIDEIQAYLNARLSSSQRNLFFNYFTLQTGKRGVDMGYTAHQPFLIDKVLRYNTHKQVWCYRIPRKINLPLRAVYLEIFDLETRSITPIRKLFSDPWKYFGLYNTKQIVSWEIKKPEIEKPKLLRRV